VSRMNFWKQLGLRTRVLAILAVLVLISLMGGATMFWHTYRMDALLTSVVDMNVAALQAAQQLETELINQKGFVSYYFMDGDPKWLNRMQKHRKAFNEQLGKVWETVETKEERKILTKIEREYGSYINSKDQVITLYKAGKKDAGLRFHHRIRGRFFGILNLCENYKDIHNKKIKRTLAESHAEAKKFRIVAATGIATFIVVGAILAFVLVSQILNPIRRLTMDAAFSGSEIELGNDVATLGQEVHDLIENIGRTRTELEHSRERLLRSEKMAVMGKLSAEVAHSIRNPLTSIKMRLFSLQRSLALTPDLKEDFGVVSEEMHRLDDIVQNFLEFSRPPKLEKQKINISDIVDMSLQLLEKRLEHSGIAVQRRRGDSIPMIEADPELLKEVLVNLIINACEAMSDGGRLIIGEKIGVTEKVEQAVFVQISDTGPGVPELIWDKVMEPFFSTKEDGTGLGLSIAKQVIEEHGGQLELRKGETEGATFVVILPVYEGEK